MTPRNFSLTAAIIFAVIALVQLARAIFGWPVIDRHLRRAAVVQLGRLHRCGRAFLLWLEGLRRGHIDICAIFGFGYADAGIGPVVAEQFFLSR